jgi:DNA-binding transcriptional LysR family regulator
MKVFVRVAQRSAFASAARDLRMSPAAVTKHVAALEDRVGARLFDRTTRRVALTVAGRIYLERCLECLRTFEDADAAVRQLTRKPRGPLRVTAPVDFADVLAGVAARFLEDHPDVTIDLRLSNRPVDLVQEGIDLAVRIGSPSLEGEIVARLLAPITVVVVASAAYLERHGPIRHPADLARHRSIVFTEPAPRLAWTFERNGKNARVVVTPVLTSNSGNALVAAAAEGAGIAIGPSFLMRPSVRAGLVKPLLGDWTVVPDLRLYAAYTHRRFVSPAVTFFVEALRAVCGDGKKDPFAVEAISPRGTS